MKVIILGGFLGSGKTSVLLQLAKGIVSSRGLDAGSPKMVIIENEIGEVGVDDKLLKAGGYKVENMFSGCICCSMAGDIVTNLSTISKDFAPEFVIIESSGVGYPFNIKENIEHSLGYRCCIVTVADAKRWKRLLKPMEMMLSDQLKESNFVLVNKKDLVDDETLSFVNKSVSGFVPEAKVYNISAISGIDDSIIQEVIGSIE